MKHESRLILAGHHTYVSLGFWDFCRIPYREDLKKIMSDFNYRDSYVWYQLRINEKLAHEKSFLNRNKMD